MTNKELQQWREYKCAMKRISGWRDHKPSKRSVKANGKGVGFHGKRCHVVPQTSMH